MHLNGLSTRFDNDANPQCFGIAKKKYGQIISANLRFCLFALRNKTCKVILGFDHSSIEYIFIPCKYILLVLATMDVEIPPGC